MVQKKNMAFPRLSRGTCLGSRRDRRYDGSSLKTMARLEWRMSRVSSNEQYSGSSLRNCRFVLVSFDLDCQGTSSLPGDTDRLHNQSILSLVSSSLTTARGLGLLDSSSQKLFNSSCDADFFTNESFASVSSSNETSSLLPNATTVQTKSDGQRLLFIIVGSVGAVLVLTILVTIVMCLNCRKKDIKKEAKSTEKPALPRSSKAEKEDVLSSGSSESGQTGLSADAQSESSAQ